MTFSKHSKLLCQSFQYLSLCSSEHSGTSTDYHFSSELVQHQVTLTSARKLSGGADRCRCKGACIKGRCSCHQARRMCSSRCHPGSSACLNAPVVISMIELPSSVERPLKAVAVPQQRAVRTHTMTYFPSTKKAKRKRPKRRRAKLCPICRQPFNSKEHLKIVCYLCKSGYHVECEQVSKAVYNKNKKRKTWSCSLCL